MKDNERDEKAYSFKCFRCKKVTYFSLNDLFRKSTVPLLENITIRPVTERAYFLDCEHCGIKNKITID